jgi:trk system potassium uptake protein TrkA
MAKQALVIGLGEFGTAMAKALTERGVEVLAIDNNEDHITYISDLVDEAVCFDATDEKSLEEMAPERRDYAICAIGDESLEASIICTALLRQMGNKHVIARANDETHARILRLVGAHDVINPEQEFASWYAGQLSHSLILGEFGLGGGLVLTELKAPEEFVGQTLRELALPKKYETTIIAIRRVSASDVILPTPDLTIESEDTLVAVARAGKIEALFKDQE